MPRCRTRSSWIPASCRPTETDERGHVTDPVLEFSDVTFGYGADHPVLLGFDWRLGEGEFCSVIGPSGSGKTTLLYLAAGLRAPGTGSVALRGERVTRPSGDVGLQLQDYGLLPWYSARRNVEVALAIKGVRRAERRERAEHWLGRLGLGSVASRFPTQLSGGQRQRVALARQFALGNELLLLDEPLSAVDELARERLQRELFTLTREGRKTTVMVTHSVEEAVLLSSSVLLITDHAPIAHAELLRTPFGGEMPSRTDPSFQALCGEIRERLRA